MSFFRHIVGCVFYMNKNQRKSLEFDVKAKNSDILFRMLNKSSHLNRSQLCNSWKIEVRGQILALRTSRPIALTVASMAALSHPKFTLTQLSELTFATNLYS